MKPFIPDTMTAEAIDRFGGPEVLRAHVLPVPKPRAREVLIRLEAAGIGVWDEDVRSGEFELSKASFPKIIGNDGAGTVVAVGKGVDRCQVGDRVYAYTFRGGFYAQYVVVREDDVAIAPPNLPTEEAGALGADGVTALIGLEDKLGVSDGDALLVFGASGGIGHLAVQLAKRMGARVLGVASGADGVELVRRLGADVAVDGRRDDVPAAIRKFAPQGLDAALVLTGGKSRDQALALVKKKGKIAHPNGVEPAPKSPAAGVQVIAYDGEPSPDVLDRLNAWICAGPFHVELWRTYELEDAARAHRELPQHHLGKRVLHIHAH
jgi:NADPH:quinone reductase-like Zn-dependent oxidoreductase